MDNERLHRPQQVVDGVKFLYWALGLNLFVAVLIFVEDSAVITIGSISLLLFAIIITALVWFFIIGKIALGRTWARAVFMVLFVFSTVHMITTAMSLIGVLIYESNLETALSYVISRGIWTVSWVLHLLAAIKLFNHDSNDWFSARKKKNNL